MKSHIVNFVLCVMLLLALPALAAGNKIIRLATTTSTANSGLLDQLLPRFEQRCGCKVHVIAVGTGKALKLGEDGNVDVVLVHAREAEDAFMAAGHGVNRRDVMYNDFVLIGPASDPAGISGAKTAVEAMRKIARHGARFVSREDDSGTHKKEKSYWKQAGMAPETHHETRWYFSAGQGMGEVLTMSAEMQAYTLTDRGTYLSYHNKLGLPILLQGDPSMFNPYSIMAVNPEKYPAINFQGAMALIDWVTSKEGQALIGAFKLNGEQLFIPSAK